MKLKTIKDINLCGKKVILRAELDVPVKDGIVESETRLKANIETINYLLENNVKQILIIGHMGRPKQKEEKYSLKQIIPNLQKLLNKDIFFAENFDINKELIKDKQIVLFENTRFYSEEKNNDENFAKKISEFGDVFVNNAFGVLTSNHVSITGIPKFLPSYAGIQIIKEINTLNIDNLKKPVALILGGAKMETKLPVITNMLDKVDKIMLGSATVILLLKSKNMYEGKLVFTYGNMNSLKEIANSKKIIYPVDFACAKSMDSKEHSYKKLEEINEDDYVLDLGPESLKIYESELLNMESIIWNGPLGFYEVPEYAQSSENFAKFLSNTDKITLIGGGDTEEILNKLNIKDKFNHISVGGGSMLRLLSGEKLVGLEILKKNKKNKV